MPFIDTEPDSYMSSFLKAGLTDFSVLFTNVFLALCLLFFPVFQAFAETALAPSSATAVTVPTELYEDYSSLLLPIFTEVNRPIPEDANAFVKDLAAYRLQVFRHIEENGKMLASLVVLAEELPSPQREEYRKLIAATTLQVAEQRNALFPYLEGDTFLRTAVIIAYEAYPSLLDRFFYRFENTVTVEGLRGIREDSSSARRSIALLYSRIQRERCLQVVYDPSLCSGR